MNVVSIFCSSARLRDASRQGRIVLILQCSVLIYLAAIAPADALISESLEPNKFKL